MLKACFPQATKLKCRAKLRHYCNFIVSLLFFFSYFAYSATQEQLDNVRHTAESFAMESIESPEGAQIEATAAPLDNRIEASDCPTGLSAFSASRSGSATNITVLVKCEAEGWRIYVPVKLTMQIPAVVAVVPLGRGQIISEEQISLNMVNVLRLRQQTFTSTSQIIGAKIKRNVSLGDIIDSNDICIVCRNDAVTIKAVNSGMSITTQGVALSDGSYGDQIRVKNTKSNRIVDAQVSGIGEVIVRF